MTTNLKLAASAALAALLAAGIAVQQWQTPAEPAAPVAQGPVGQAKEKAAEPTEFWGTLPDPLVTVNGEPIRRAEVQAALPADVSASLQEREPRLRAAVQAAARLVDARLALAQLAPADRAALQTRVDLEKAGELRRYGTDPAWRQELARRLQTPEAWLTLVQTRAALDMALEASSGPEVPSEAELRQRYDRRKARWELPGQVHWREIAVQVEAGEAEAGEQARKALEQALQRLAKGEEFGAIAEEFAMGRSRQPGGDRGWNRLDELDPALARALEALEPGQRSGLVISGHAMHIVEVLEKRPPGLRPFEEAKEQLQAELQGERRFVQRRRLLDNLRAKATVAWASPQLAELAGLAAVQAAPAQPSESPAAASPPPGPAHEPPDPANQPPARATEPPAPATRRP